MNFNANRAYDWLKSYDGEIKKLSDTSKDLRNLTKYEEIRRSIQKAAAGALGLALSSVKVHYYGSRVVGIATEDSDLDIFLELNENFRSAFTFTSKDYDQFNNLTLALNIHSGWKVEHSVWSTAVPVIRAQYIAQTLNCKFN